MSKKSKQNRNVNVVVTSKPQSKRRSRNSRIRVPSWLRSVADPFEFPGVHIPDQETRASGIVTSRITMTYNPTDSVGGNSSFNGGVLVNPCPFNWVYQLGATNGAITGNYTSLAGASNGLSVASAPNLGAMIGNQFTTVYSGSAMYRCVSMGVRVTYEGTELQRAGRYIAMEVLNSCKAISFGTQSSDSHYWFDPLSVFAGNSSQTSPLKPLSWQLLGKRVATQRITDDVLEVKWVPDGVPTYQSFPAAGAQEDMYWASSGTKTVADTCLSNAVGAEGIAKGTPSLLILIENDTPANAAEATVGNSYAIEVIGHWEVVPHDYFSVTYQITPSSFDARALELALNAFARMRIGSAVAVSNMSSNASNVQNNGASSTSLLGDSMRYLAGNLKQLALENAPTPGQLASFATALLASRMVSTPKAGQRLLTYR